MGYRVGLSRTCVSNISLLGRDMCIKSGSGKTDLLTYKTNFERINVSPFVDGFQDFQNYQNH